MFDLIVLLSTNCMDYVLVGGLAVALHGYRRVTMDVDVVLPMDEANLDRFIAAAEAAGLRPTAPVSIGALRHPALIDQWYREKGMPAFSLRSSDAVATVIDVLVKPKVPYSDLRRDAVTIDVGPHRIPVASIDHLIEMKTGAGRGQDAVDIEALKKLKAGEAP